MSGWGGRPYLGGKEASRTRHHRRGEVANEREKASPQGEGRGGAGRGPNRALTSQRWQEQVGAEPHEMGQGWLRPRLQAAEGIRGLLWTWGQWREGSEG